MSTKTTKNIILTTILMLVTTSYFVSHVFALTSYTITQVSEHNTPENCWMVIGQNVYDVTNYLPDHDNKLDIRPWCGKDATADFNSKNGRGENHGSKADSELNQYIIGTVNTVVESRSTAKNTTVQNKQFAGYNVLLPFFGTIIGYFLSFKFLKRLTHNFIWNSIMLLGLVPSFVFGMIMALAKQYAWADALKYKTMINTHVELSVIFGVACVLHFVFRLKIYLAQGKSGTG